MAKTLPSPERCLVETQWSVQERAWKPLAQGWSLTRGAALVREGVRSERGAEAKSTGGNQGGHGQREVGGDREGGFKKRDTPQQRPRPREDNALKTEMPPSLVAESTADLSESPSGGGGDRAEARLQQVEKGSPGLCVALRIGLTLQDD